MSGRNCAARHDTRSLGVRSDSHLFVVTADDLITSKCSHRGIGFHKNQSDGLWPKPFTKLAAQRIWMTLAQGHVSLAMKACEEFAAANIAFYQINASITSRF